MKTWLVVILPNMRCVRLSPRGNVQIPRFDDVGEHAGCAASEALWRTVARGQTFLQCANPGELRSM